MYAGVVLLLAVLLSSSLHAREIELTPLDEIAPDMYLGPDRMLSDLHGRWVLLHYWATWCEPCIEELPALERFHRRSGGALTIITVAMDGNDVDSVTRFREQFGITLPVVQETDAAGHRPYTGWGLPATYLIAPDGRLRGRALGVRNWDDIEAASLLRQLDPA